MELSELMQHYRQPLIGLIVSWGTSWPDAAEVAQDSFAEAYLKRHLCRGDWTQREVFGKWLRGVARNVHRNWLRGQRRREGRVQVESPLVEQVASESMPEVSEPVRRLRLAIERLSATHRQVVLMHYLDETSINDVAILLAVSVKTVEGRLYQARRRLRELLDAATEGD